MSKEKPFMELKLSELVEQSLAKGVIPFFKFLDKDKVEMWKAEELKSVSPMEETPVYILQKKVEFYKNMIARLETREGIIPEGPDADEKIKSLITDLSDKIKSFESAISILKEN